MDAIEAVKKELQSHQAKLLEYQSELYDVEQTVRGLQAHQADLKDKLAFEKGVIQSLEFAIILIDKGQKPEDK